MEVYTARFPFKPFDEVCMRLFHLIFFGSFEGSAMRTTMAVDLADVEACEQAIANVQITSVEMPDVSVKQAVLQFLAIVHKHTLPKTCVNAILSWIRRFYDVIPTLPKTFAAMEQEIIASTTVRVVDFFIFLASLTISLPATGSPGECSF
jgi:hypothetical protein